MKKEPEYEYLCVDAHGKYFIAIGNFRTVYNKPHVIYQFNPTIHKVEVPLHWNKSHYGYRCNTSDGRIPKNFTIIHQMERHKLEQ